MVSPCWRTCAHQRRFAPILMEFQGPRRRQAYVPALLDTTRTVLDHCLARGRTLTRVRGAFDGTPEGLRCRAGKRPALLATQPGQCLSRRRPANRWTINAPPTVLPTVADWWKWGVGCLSARFDGRIYGLCTISYLPGLPENETNALSPQTMPETPARHVQTSPKSIFFSPLLGLPRDFLEVPLLSPHLPPFRLASASCPVTPSSRPPINSVLVTFTLVSSVLTHGWIGSVSVNVGGAKKLFKGNEPTEELPNAASSAIRQQPPLATVAAGSKLDVFWQTLTGSGFWFHDVGPMMAYTMADCGGNCAQFDASKAKWFKIQEQGMDASGKWAQANLDNGSPATVTIPANLKAGNYLLRHEIIALHTAQSQGGAEFYPGCVQLSVTSAGKGVPSDSETVKLPGAYKPTDAGILIDVYNMKGAYKFPGPAVASFIGGGSPAPAQGGSDDNTTEKPSSPATTKKSTSPPASSTTKKASSPASSTTSVASAVPTKSGSASCRAKRSHHRRQEVVDVREEVRRSRVRHMHRAGVARSF
ncbi:hypothetical protein MIND_01158100 [Mycena indigotica]|uniref:lytic cellulose monooxygenase (C4-dehydrogenating) n=1 Tax=Mycena indigotica TaxID=2126181 RepID=A0A8H6S6A4_9AGAR|nr:uncharacterized protein MIND_01158100 [Mycena indigotica]KAF7292602.1 hypothetical protein MIND_01158100 [Mycena indigotica]